MTQPEITVENLNKVVRLLNRADRKDLVDLLKAAHLESAKTVEGAAKTKVPRLTNTLADSLRSAGTARGGFVRAGKKRVPYAGPIHFGWPQRNIRPQPFLFEALDSRRSQVEDVFNERVAALASRINAETS